MTIALKNILDIKRGDIVEVRSGDTHLSRHIILNRYLEPDGSNTIVSFAIFVNADIVYSVNKLNTVWEMDLAAYVTNSPENKVTIL
tara:strand:+ start:393 stop:650 length:258 start_codon:yes stop_codon:yes gene_type:complete